MSENTIDVVTQSPLLVASLGKGSPSQTINGIPVIVHRFPGSKCLYATPFTSVLKLCVWVKLEASNADLKWGNLSLKGYTVEFHPRVNWSDGHEGAAVSLRCSRSKHLTGAAFKAVLRDVIEALQTSHEASSIDTVSEIERFKIKWSVVADAVQSL